MEKIIITSSCDLKQIFYCLKERFKFLIHNSYTIVLQLIFYLSTITLKDIDVKFTFWFIIYSLQNWEGWFMNAEACADIRLSYLTPTLHTLNHQQYTHTKRILIISFSVMPFCMILSNWHPKKHWYKNSWWLSFIAHMYQSFGNLFLELPTKP